MSALFRDDLAERLKDPAFKAEYDALEPDFNIANAMMDTQIKYDLTPEQLAERTGLPQDEIDKLGMADGDPTLSTLKQLAAGMGMKLKLEFVAI
ncbi:MAG: transcriptional regulator [Synergistaceae bacterium]|nr:transcriptional regulator [Synergistaceae bacterium]MBQ4419543.1 transcriptional regulator [Synergistaceae bacterium]MBQ6740766.1 transcriptional regulator [Synergistaceae bacterium]MBQ6909455.1 transcriptional regulator [Synergistaceae bacterium]MBR0043796.1 transcriptional regulator [Synergistaceae bacterium]